MGLDVIKPAIDEGRRVTEVSRGFTVPYSVLAPIVAVMIATLGFSFRNEARITSLETTASSPTKYDAQFAALTQKLSDFQEEYQRDRINDRVVDSRQGKP